MYGLEFVFVPASISIFIGKPIAMYILAVFYLVMDVICISFNLKKVDKLVSVDWYTD